MTFDQRQESAMAIQRLSLGRAIVHTILALVCTGCVLPLLLIVAASSTEEATLVNQGFRLIPSRWSLDAYRFLLSDPNQILRAYGISLLVTLSGTAVSLLLMSLLGYALSRRDFVLRGPLTFFVFFPLLR